MRIPVCKYHGAGNDFIMLDYERFAALDDPIDFIVKVCDRHTGIGADGLIAVKRPAGNGLLQPGWLKSPDVRQRHPLLCPLLL